MKKIGVLILILGMLVFIVGCEQSGGGTDTPTRSPYIGGSQGIVASFEQMGIIEDGVNTVWEGETFPVEITIKNKGEQDILMSVAAGSSTPIADPNLRIGLKGVDTSIVTNLVTPKVNALDLSGLDEFNKLGGEETIKFYTGTTLPTVGSIDTPYLDIDFYANIDYDYTTYAAVPKVCFKEDERDETICDLSGTKTLHTSGAPVKIASVRQDPAGSNIIALTFELENVGGGKTTLPGSATEFDSRYDQVQFTFSEDPVPASNPDATKVYWTCRAGGSTTAARLVDGKATIRCTSTELPPNTLYTKQTVLTLDYKYRTVIHQTVRVKESQ